MQTVAPASEPIALDTAKNQCRVDSDITQDDALITSLITVARSYAEVYQKRALITQQFKYSLDMFPFFRSWALIGSPIKVPVGPVQSIDEITFTAPDGTVSTLDSSLYLVDTYSVPARITPAYGQTWPTMSLYVPNAVQVNLTAGYGDSGSSVPAETIQAMLLLIAHWYINREAVGDFGTPVPFAVKSLLDMNCWGDYF